MTASSDRSQIPDAPPSVLAVLVVHEAERWLRETLSSLAAQTYPRFGIVAVDNASTDGSRALLVEALGENRVRTLTRNTGLAGGLDQVLRQPGAERSEFVLLLHDDVQLDPDAVSRLVEAAVGIPGISDVGIVGGKVVDADDPRALVDVGRSADRFGHPDSPLQPDEIDQGQFDRVLEVLAVHSAAMLVARDTWKRVGGFDERVDSRHADLDFCWRARVAGFRVLMTPLARIRHRGASGRGQRPGRRSTGTRYEEDRAAIVAMLKNDSIGSLIARLPVSIGLTLVRIAFLLLGRRFEEAYDVASAWAWNVAHLRGTLARRRVVQKERRVRDRELRRFTDSAGIRLPRWFQTAEKILGEQHVLDEEEEGRPIAQRMRHRTASLVSSHPVIVASLIGLVVSGFASRHLIDPPILAGGRLPFVPPSVAGLFGELGSAVRSTGFGGSLAASPALGALGVLTWATVGSTSLMLKVVLAATPAIAAALAYRAAVRLTGRPGPSTVAAGAYATSGIMLWSFSEGRLSGLVLLATLPVLLERFEVAFGPAEPPDGTWRFVAGLGVGLAVAVAFDPGALVAGAVIVVVQLVMGNTRRRGLRLAGSSTLVAAVLLFPSVPTLAAGGARALGSEVHATEASDLWTLALGGGPGTWIAAGFVLVAAALAFGLVGEPHRGPAARAAAVTVVALGLAALSGTGYVPGALSNAPAYLSLAAIGAALVIAFGLSSVVGGLGGEAFGLRQVSTAVLTGVLAGGIGLQAVSAMIGGWAVGGTDKVPAAWAVISGAEPGDFRVVWVGSDDGRSFPYPGGEPDGVIDAASASLRYAVTGPHGATVLDLGRPLVGPGADRFERALGEIMSGSTSHGGHLLAPFGIRYVVASEGDLPRRARSRFSEQVDLDEVPTSGLVVFRNAFAFPPASVVQVDGADRTLALSGDPADTIKLRTGPPGTLSRAAGGWSGNTPVPGLVLLSTEFDAAWRLDGSEASPRRSFGWATAFDAGAGPIRVRTGAQLPRTIEVVVLAALWIAALWITRKPAAR